MNATAGLVLFIISLLITLGSFAYLIKKLVDYIKSISLKVDVKKTYKEFICLASIFTLGFMLTFIFVHIMHNNSTTPSDWVWTIIGSLLLGASIITFTISFAIHYYKKGLEEKLDKRLFILQTVSIIGMLIFFFFLTNGFADYLNLNAPLANGINFQSGLSYPGGSTKANITFYALCILTGAVFVFFLADHKMYMQYGKHGLLESTFLVAFPAGIIGARIAYVIGNWQEFQGREWWRVFAIWEGGLTILGGAIAGIVVGVLWFKWRNKSLNAWVAVDICAPVILIAQAMGRWGNFFNCEVYGGLVNEEYFRWLPKIIFNNMHFNNAGVHVTSGFIQAPLFFIEGIVNILGYTVLAHLFGNLLKKYIELGDLSFGYLIWYGFTRVFMEPLRDPAYNMGSDGYWSWFWSIVFVAAGVILISLNHLIRYFIRKKKNEETMKYSYKSQIIFAISVFVGALALTIVGASLMGTNTFVQTINLNPYNIGVVCLVVGLSCFFLEMIPLPNIFAYKSKESKNETN